MISGPPLFNAAASASLDDIDISQELLARSIRTRNRKTETAAMYALAGSVNHGSSVVLKHLSNLAIELCNAGSAGVSVLEPGETGELFRWQALGGEIEKYQGGSTPRDWSPCGETLRAGRAMLFSYPARYFTYFQQLSLPIVEGLVIPMFTDGSPVGTIWVVSHTATRRFDAEHVRIMTSLGAFAVSALHVTRTSGAGADPSFHGHTHVGSGFADETKIKKDLVWAEYVRRVLHGDELALADLYQETYALVFVMALRILSFRADAEEVAADVYARVWMSAGTFDPNRGGVSAWLVSMARSSAIDRLRARAVQTRSEAGLLAAFNSSDNPEAQIDASETEQRVRRALRALPVQQRQAIELFYFSELSVAAIAAKLRQPLGTVKTRIRIGRSKLRRLLAALETRGSRARHTHRAIPGSI